MFDFFNKEDRDFSSDKNSGTHKDQEEQSEGTTFVNENIGDAQPQDIPRKEQ